MRSVLWSAQRGATDPKTRRKHQHNVQQHKQHQRSAQGGATDPKTRRKHQHNVQQHKQHQRKHHRKRHSSIYNLSCCGDLDSHSTTCRVAKHRSDAPFELSCFFPASRVGVLTAGQEYPPPSLPPETTRTTATATVTPATETAKVLLSLHRKQRPSTHCECMCMCVCACV